MYCSKCGTQNPDNANFCSKCGNNLSLKPEIIERKGIPGKLGKMGVYGFRSGKTWKMVLATLVYFNIGIFVFVVGSAIIAAFVFGMGTPTETPTPTSILTSTPTPAQVKTSILITASPSQMLPTINDMPDSSQKAGETTNETYAERTFVLSSLGTPQALKYQAYKFSSINEAIDKYNSIKNEKSDYKLTNVNLGDEGFGLEEANSIATVVFRKANVVVRVQMMAPYITTLYQTISYAKKVTV